MSVSVALNPPAGRGSLPTVDIPHLRRDVDNERVRTQASILHLDLDAFFAAVEQRDKPSLRGKPVVVGGLGPRGVVSTASYEARAFGIRSAMSMNEARSRCPHAAFLTVRFHAYQEASRTVMALLRDLSPLVEPLSLDEAFVDLAFPPTRDLTIDGVTRLADDLKAAITGITGGLTSSAGLASSKLMAKIASELGKPDGLVVVPPGTEIDVLGPLPVTVIPGVGPATTERLRRVGVHTVAELERISEPELVRLVGKAHGHALHLLAQAQDDRRVDPERESKSVSLEDTFETDLVDPVLLKAIVERHALRVSERLRAHRLSGRTVTVKVRLHDFTTHTRSSTLRGPTDDARVIARLARSLVTDVDTSGGVRLLGVGVSGLADWIQDDLFADSKEVGPLDEVGAAAAEIDRRGPDRSWQPGVDVEHATFGRGWVWGSGREHITVRFETAETGPGAIHTFPIDDPDLRPASPPVQPTRA
jgi:DNA polymerase IV